MVVLRGISPMIWRRLLLRSDHSIADLHYTIQIAMGWCVSHLHLKRVHTLFMERVLLSAFLYRSLMSRHQFTNKPENMLMLRARIAVLKAKERRP